MPGMCPPDPGGTGTAEATPASAGIRPGGKSGT